MKRKNWVELTELAGEIYIKNGTRQRFVVYDVTLGADLVLIPYRLNGSHRRHNSYEHIRVTQENLEKEYRQIK